MGSFFLSYTKKPYTSSTQRRRSTSEYSDPFVNGENYTLWVDIGDQEPILGEDPETKENPILFGIDWLSLTEICERDRAFVWVQV